MSLLRTILRAPLLHFLLIGAGLFLWDAAGSGPPPASGLADARIVLTVADADGLAERFEQTWRRPLTPAELDALIEARIEEEILVREARALSLHAEDPVIRTRLVQKMRFLLASAAAAREPTEVELSAFFAERRADYAAPARVSFEQVLLGEAAAAAAPALEALAAGADPNTVGRHSVLPPTMRAATPAAVDGVFGAGVFEALSAAATGVWSGPVHSGYGLHAVRVTAVDRGRVPELAELRERVVQDWRAMTAADGAARLIRELRAGYAVERPSADALRTALQ